MSLTEAQQAAIAARGNVLVMAGAGTGKTRTLVERCLRCLTPEKTAPGSAPPAAPAASLDQILVVTFTEAAAAEMRARLRARLEAEAAADPADPHWPEQIALFETAHIGTLHSFCLKLVRQRFYDLELDPQINVLTEEEGQLLIQETLEGMIEAHYTGASPASAAVRDLIAIQGGGRDEQIKAMVRRLHHYTQTLPDPAAWWRDQIERFAAPEPAAWRAWYAQGLADWRDQWQPRLQRVPAENEVIAAAVAALRGLDPAKEADLGAGLEAIATAPGRCPRGRKGIWVDPFASFFAEAEFLASLAPVAAGGKDPLAEDWDWVRGPMVTLLELGRAFADEFTEAKRELGVVDFHDLEQHALRLLWDEARSEPTAIARQWRAQLRFVFVDEYQDINAAQDRIIQALSRDGGEANRFLVGDVKQSIYRFRLADPRIFQGYARSWDGRAGRTIALRENFRSREGLLAFINSLFSLVLKPGVGGVAYDERAQLRFGAPAERAPLGLAAGRPPVVEILFRSQGGPQAEREEPGDPGELLDGEKEARLLALRLRELKESGHLIWDESKTTFRPVDWGDMAVLLRSPAGKAESFAKEFARLGVPLQVQRRGFYRSAEILDLLSLLELLDNPLQDVPALAVLHSPLVGLTVDELARVRLARRGPYWSALLAWFEGESSDGVPTTGTPGKVGRFLERYDRWRRLARQTSLSGCLEAVLAETHYAEWLLTQPRGADRRANVHRLLALARQFDQFRRQGLFRFLLFTRAQQESESEPEVPAVAGDNAVRLMSIHQSKGLEFPVVAVACLGKPFNRSDLRAEIILDEVYGPCPLVRSGASGCAYPSLTHWLAARRQQREAIGEELRLLYVALTRARDTLILTGAVPPKKLEDLWEPGEAPGGAEIIAANCAMDWIRLWFTHEIAGKCPVAGRGENGLVRWRTVEEVDLTTAVAATPEETPAPLAAPPEVWRGLESRLTWRYPFAAATTHPAKTSVTLLRRQAAREDEELAAKIPPPPFEFRKPAGEADPRSIGNAHHAFLEQVRLDRTTGLGELRAEAERLRSAGVLDTKETALLDFEALAVFWESELGTRVREAGGHVWRELAFTARFSPAELAQITGLAAAPELAEEFVVVQGTVDLAVVAPDGIWILDFKTDRLNSIPGAAAAKAAAYAPQLRLYAMALSRIYQRPVTGAWLYFLPARTSVEVEV